MMKLISGIFAALATMVGLASAEPPPASSVAPKNLREGSLFPEVIFYYAPDPATPPREAMQMAVEKEMKGIPILHEYPPKIDPPFIVLTDETAPLKRYPVPNTGYLQHSGHGLSDEDHQAIQTSSRASCAVLFNTRDGQWQRAKAFNNVAHVFAVETKAHIWDSATRECFHRDAWKKRRIDGWGDREIPDLRSQIAIHRYPKLDAGYFRSVTRGMGKFGLYDVVIERSADSEAAAASNLMQVFCQTIAANPVLEAPLRTPISIESLPPQVAKSYREGMFKNGTGKAELAIMRGAYDQGNEDPDNELVEFDFRYGKGNTDDERRAELLKRFWGSQDK